MDRSDLLERLFKTFREDNRNGFHRVPDAIIADEKGKNRLALAEEFSRIMDSGLKERPEAISDRAGENSCLYEVICQGKKLTDLVLSGINMESIDEIIEEHQNWDLYADRGICPQRRIFYFTVRRDAGRRRPPEP
ncbi:MAG: hypothetical protein LBP22_03540 [Deltaproteobacteria bacterium]|jgi:hypothetical protein|nr:hypothetical protein [Deltaproteobacteria bacterium]